MVQRHLSATISRYAMHYPAITITGPRQSGKTTLSKTAFPHHYWLNLENPNIHREAIDDPTRFLLRYGKNIILDEIQRAPELLSFVQDEVDKGREMGRFILTGSAQLELMEKVSQTLAGRTALAELLPFSMSEILQPYPLADIDTLLYSGFYPRIYDQNLIPSEAHSFYLRTYIERDVRKLLNIRDLSRFDLFLRLCAGRCGQLMNMNALGNDAGLNHGTVSGWLSVLEASYIAFLLRPHHQNFNKRLVKSPKLYFYDCGIICNLLNIENAASVAFHPLRGQIFESFIISELVKQRYHAGKQNNLWFWRDNVGHEIDCLFDFGASVFPVEIKSGSTIPTDFFKNLFYYQQLNPSCQRAALIYGGDKSYRQGNYYVISYKDIAVFESLDSSCTLPI